LQNGLLADRQRLKEKDIDAMSSYLKEFEEIENPSETASQTTPSTAPLTVSPPLVIDLTGLSDLEQSPQPPNRHSVKKRTNQNIRAKTPLSKAPFTSHGRI
jgi:hypothetical protein